MKQFLVKADVHLDGKFFCKAEREIWAATPNAAKIEFENTNKGQGFTLKNVSVKELKVNVKTRS